MYALRILNAYIYLCVCLFVLILMRLIYFHVIYSKNSVFHSTLNIIMILFINISSIYLYNIVQMNVYIKNNKCLSCMSVSTFVFLLKSTCICYIMLNCPVKVRDLYGITLSNMNYIHKTFFLYFSLNLICDYRMIC